MNPLQSRCMELSPKESIQTKILVLSDSIEIYFFPGHLRVLKETSTQVFINNDNVTAKVFYRLKNKIILIRGDYKDTININIKYKGYPDMEFEIKGNVVFKRIDIFYKKDTTGTTNSLAGFIRETNKPFPKKIKDRSVYLNADSLEAKTDGLLRDYEFSGIEKSDHYKFYTKLGQTPQHKSENNNKDYPDPSYLITLFKPRSDVRLNVVLDDSVPFISVPPK